MHHPKSTSHNLRGFAAFAGIALLASCAPLPRPQHDRHRRCHVDRHSRHGQRGGNQRQCRHCRHRDRGPRRYDRHRRRFRDGRHRDRYRRHGRSRNGRGRQRSGPWRNGRHGRHGHRAAAARHGRHRRHDAVARADAGGERRELPLPAEPRAFALRVPGQLPQLGRHGSVDAVQDRHGDVERRERVSSHPADGVRSREHVHAGGLDGVGGDRVRDDRRGLHGHQGRSDAVRRPVEVLAGAPERQRPDELVDRIGRDGGAGKGRCHRRRRGHRVRASDGGQAVGLGRHR